ncbi:MAG: response regulator transcription factor [Desulfobacterales bacterium]
MSIRISEKQNSGRFSTGTTFYLVGPMRLQNELIAKCLEKENGNACILLENINQIPTGNPKPPTKSSLVLWDCGNENLKGLLSELKTYAGRKKAETRVVLFNVPNGMEFNKKFVLKGIHGFFYKQDSLDIFLKGVQNVINGKLWLSREMMTKCIFEDSGSVMSPKRSAGNLTERQTEILALIAVGDTNDEIAEKLCISPHTVKTHLYKIFKKINVPNRVQAAFWAAKNL